jgi:hypothetical protein
MKAPIPCVVLLASLLVGGWAYAQSVAPDGKLAHGGFVVNISAIKTPEVLSAMMKDIRAQIDVVNRVTLKPGVREFFQSIQFEAFETYPPPRDRLQNAALYVPDERRILMRQYTGPVNQNGPSVAPVLLHEYMHAYHALRLPDGPRNPDVLRLWRQAGEQMLFPPDAYMLSSSGEYFAMMASVYLYGSAGRDPFTRTNIKAKQPEAYEWLEREFGPQPN